MSGNNNSPKISLTEYKNLQHTYHTLKEQRASIDQQMSAVQDQIYKLHDNVTDIELPQLARRDAERMLGQSFDNLVIYSNYPIAGLNIGFNRDTYNGYTIQNLTRLNAFYQNHKKYLETLPAFCEWVLAAHIGMTVDERKYKGTNPTLSDAVYDPCGEQALGNVIVYDIHANQYKCSPIWIDMPLLGCFSGNDAVQQAAQAIYICKYIYCSRLLRSALRQR
ncbi:MAG: hypothetical protein K2M34_02420 [Alphaproteobacteria bacterium]|nr:hypothetical protein [Alphaproteobacteria bacterium]